MRITKQRLENRVAILNRILKRPTEPWKTKAGGLVANIGNLHISGAYGGVALYEMDSTGGGVNDISGFGHQSKRELDTFISGMLAGAEAKKGRSKNPSKRPAHEKGFIIEDKSPKGCVYVHKQIKGFLEHARPGEIYECSVCHEQFVKERNRLKKKTRKKNPKDKNPRNYNVSRLKVVFKYTNGKVYFFDGVNWNSSKGKAALFKTSKEANLIARKLSLSMSHTNPARLGITSESTTVAEIKRKITGKA